MSFIQDMGADAPIEDAPLVVPSRDGWLDCATRSGGPFRAEDCARPTAALIIKHGKTFVESNTGHCDFIHDYNVLTEYLTVMWANLKLGETMTVRCLSVVGKCGTHFTWDVPTGLSARHLTLNFGRPGAMTSYLDDGGAGFFIELSLTKTKWNEPYFAAYIFGGES